MTLIEKLEKADKGSRELDAEIHKMIASPLQKAVAAARGEWFPPSELGQAYGPPAYTTSLDCALTLVPEGWVGWFDYCWPDFHDEKTAPYTGYVSNSKVRWIEGDYGTSEPDIEMQSAVAHTPALALCIAALKARQ